MKYKTILVALCATFLAEASNLKAQINLENFSAFQSPQTLFYGQWSASGDPFTGNVMPAATFAQGAGFYNIAGVTNADSSYVERAFTSPFNLGSNNQLALSLRLNSGNTAENIAVFLLDSHAHAAFATFQTNAFTAANFTPITLILTAEADFAWNAVSAFRISGNDPFAGEIMNVSLDSISATGAPSPVPEPSTYGLMGSGVLLACIGACRLRARA